MLALRSTADRRRPTAFFQQAAAGTHGTVAHLARIGEAVAAIAFYGRMTLRYIIVIALLATYYPAPATARDAKADALVAAGIEAQGGETTLRAIHTVTWGTTGYRNQLEQSERPKGPYLTEFREISEVHDQATGRLREDTTVAVYPVYKTTTGLIVTDGVAMRLAGEQRTPGSSDLLDYAREKLALSPERLLLTAKDAADLHRLPDVVLQGVAHEVVAFELDGAPVTVFLNADTHLPTGWDYAGPLAHRGFWNYLGDVTQRTLWSFWWLGKEGVRLPMQWQVEGNGLPDTMTSVRRVSINAAPNPDTFAIPSDIRAKYVPGPGRSDLESWPLGSPSAAAVEIAPGIVQIPGAWNVALVRQDDGVVVIEAPISSGYSAKVIAEAHRSFPNLPIKAVITTSDSWPHLAGIREYAAAGIPIYGLDRNRPILRRILGDPRSSKPDALALHPRPAVLRWVTGRTTIGTGANAIILYPLRGETSERQMMAYFPQRRLLYGSDTFQRGSDGSFFIPQTVSEVMAAATREHLAVDRVFMMHMGPTPWIDLNRAVENAAQFDTPDGKL